ncbi:MAG: hypothetical protein R6X25_13550 [Candidatus Krumholzibacteriia bacterium]
MALDEPSEQDRVVDRGTYRFVLDPQIVAILEQSGGVTVDYVDEAYQKGYLLRLNSQAGGGCGESSDGCSSCG